MSGEDKVSGVQGDSGNQALQPVEEENGKSCWVCFATEADDRLAAWVQPCKCIGTTRWVHQSCLQRWVDEKQRGNFSRKVLCPQCKAEYIVVFPSMGAFVALLDAAQRLLMDINFTELILGIVVVLLSLNMFLCKIVILQISYLFN